MIPRRLTITVVVLLATTSPSTAQPTTAPATAEAPAQVRLSVGRDDEYDPLIADLKLEGEQLARLRAADAEGRRKLVEFADGPEGKRLVELRTRQAQARREGRTDEAMRLRDEQLPGARAFMQLRHERRLAILNTLTPEQRARAAGLALERRLAPRLRRAGLTDEQRARVRAIADEVAGRWLTPERLASDPMFTGLLTVEAEAAGRVDAEVLTEEQRARLPRPRPAATAPATDGGA